MASLKEVKNRIKSVQSTQQITKAMKMVAASKLRKAQDKIMMMRPYSDKLYQVLKNVSGEGQLDNVQNEYAVERDVERVLIVVITSDRGLCGAFNSNVIKAANQIIAEKYNQQLATDDLYVLTIGKKATEYYKKRDFQIIDRFSGIFQQLKFDSAKEIGDFLLDTFKKGAYDVVEVVFNEFKNVATQIVKTDTFLPLKQESLQAEAEKAKTINADYIFQPDKATIIEEIIPKALKIRFYRYLLESNASENGARMTAMDKASDNASELLKELRLTYNRTRQAAITKEILEIVGGAEALASESK